jgi:cell division protein FtsI/penicillin-binding protein 2
VGWASPACGRAVYVQVLHTDFFQKQGEARYAHAGAAGQPRPHPDRNGQVLAASVAVPSIWAIPKEVEADPAKRASWPRRWASAPGAGAANRVALRLAQAPGRRQTAPR